MFFFTQPQVAGWYGDGLCWNDYYHVWRLESPGASFGIDVYAPEAGPSNLIITHLSSSSDSCPGGGYSPVTINVNGVPLVVDYDVAENHGNTHGWVTEAFPVYLACGRNRLVWTAGALCTHYWIQNIQVFR
jgi:hypothetical protein